MEQANPEPDRRQVVISDAELTALRVRLILDVVKTVATVVGAVILFLIIQRPDSVLNREASRDTISRERAKLLLEWIRESDPEKRNEAFAVISAAYGESENQWLKSAEFILKQRARYQALEGLIQEKRSLLDQLQKQLTLEVAGQGPSGRYGYGPVANELRNQIAKVDLEIKELSARPNSTAGERSR
jgi:hypothetical protein